MKKIISFITAISLILSLTACSQSGESEAPRNEAGKIDSDGAKGDRTVAAGAAGGTGAGVTAAGSVGAEAPAKTEAPSGAIGGGDEAADKIAEAGDAGIEAEGSVRHDDFSYGELPAEDYEYDIDYDIDYGEYPYNSIPEAAGTLTAGEWIDNNHYTFWQNLFQKEDTGWESYRSVWDRSYCSRTFATVTQNGEPVENSSLTLSNANGEVLWRAKTDNEGKAYLFFSPSELSKGELILTSDFGGEMTVSSEDAAVSFTIDAPENRSASKALDLALVVDTTGSMSDELSYLQKELENVIERAARDNGNIPVRLSVSFYRDDGDEYVVKEFDFTENIDEAVRILNEQEADGGGDTPEKVNRALDTAINELSWEESSTKLLFIILDAPPHNDDSEAVIQMNELTEQAAERGVRVIPILASGGSKETEFLMRDFALKTGGSYMFLTDDSGVSVGGHIEPTIGEYNVYKLNDLMVRVINRYLANDASAAEYVDDVVLTSPAETDPVVTLPPTDLDGRITMELTDTLEEGDEPPFEFIIKNGTEYEYYYGLGFGVEKLDGGEWVNLPPTEDFAVIEIAMILAPGESHKFEANVYKFWKNLTPGEYRVVLTLSGEPGTETVYGLFEIV